jgi:hypothetical protein
MHSSTFDAAHVLHTLEHMLPAQNAMREFVHHNSLHAFQQYPFFEALFSASETFGFNTTLSLKEYRALYEAGRISTQVLHDVLDQAHGAKHREGLDAQALRPAIFHGSGGTRGTEPETLAGCLGL